MPVNAGGGAVATESWPLVGSQPSRTLNRSCSSRAAQKAGRATPDTASTRMAWSNGWLRRTAASMPSGTPTTTENAIDSSTSSSVAGK